MKRFAEDQLRWRFFHHLAGVHDADAVGHVGVDAHVVGDQDDGVAQLLLDIDEKLHDAALHDHVEGGGRLIGDDEAWLQQGGEGDRDALAHAARQLMGVGFHHLRRQAQLRYVPLGQGKGLVARTHFNVADDEVLVRILQLLHRIEDAHRPLGHVGHILPPQPSHLLGVERGDVDCLPLHAIHDPAAEKPQRRLDDAGQRLEQCGFATTAFAGDAVDFVRVNLQFDPIDGFHHRLVAANFEDVERLQFLRAQYGASHRWLLCSDTLDARPWIEVLADAGGQPVEGHEQQNREDDRCQHPPPVAE